MPLQDRQTADLAVGKKSHLTSELGDASKKVSQGMVADLFHRPAQNKLGNRPRQPNVLVRPRRGSSFRDSPEEYSNRQQQQQHYSHSRGLSSSDDSAASSSRRGSASTSAHSLRRGSSHTDLESQRAEPVKGKRPDLVSSASFESDPRSTTLSACGRGPFSASASLLLDNDSRAETESLTFQEALESLSASSTNFQDEVKDPVITQISTTTSRGASGPGTRRHSRSRVSDSFKPFGQYGRGWLWPLSKKQKPQDLTFAQCVQVTQEITIEIQTDPDYRPPKSAQAGGQDGTQVPRNPNEYPDFRTHHELFGGGPPSPTQTDEEARNKSRPAWKKHSRFSSNVVATWPPPNHTNPQRRGPALLVIELTILPIALITLLLRLYVRVRIVKSYGWDDWFMVAAAACGLGVTLCTIIATQGFSWNAHIWDLTPEQIVEGRKVSLASQTLFTAATALAKASILLSYLRIAPQKSWFRRLTFSALALVSTIGFAAISLFWTQCMPISSYWFLQDPSQVVNCGVDEGLLAFAQALCNVCTDLIVYVLPIPTLAALSLPLGQRIATIALFSLGLIVVVAGCMRAYWISYVVAANLPDFTWEGYHLWIWTAVECQLSVICGCVPVLKPLFFMMLGRDVGFELRREDIDDVADFDFCDIATTRDSKAYTMYARSIHSSHTNASAIEAPPTARNTNRFSFVWASSDGLARTNVVVETSDVSAAANPASDPWYPGTRPAFIPGMPPPPRPPRSPLPPDMENGMYLAEICKRHTMPNLRDDEANVWVSASGGVRTVITAGDPMKPKAKSLRWV
ncbi:hypothetical protein PspLS_10722 [Pyricularia sp. CBS 133598]|nr:hypothetical protein PspLS_10722 [Pyricularia sp. CBS 133598]